MKIPFNIHVACKLHKTYKEKSDFCEGLVIILCLVENSLSVIWIYYMINSKWSFTKASEIKIKISLSVSLCHYPNACLG